MSATRVDPPVSGSDAALHRYRARLRRQRLVYFSVIGVVVLALAVAVTVVWERGEVANTTLHTVAKPPAALPVATPAAAAQVRWRTSDRAAYGDPSYAGTVVVHGKHTVRGIDARTGTQTWSYTRSDRTVCAAVLAAGRVVASYEVNGNCDELTGLDARTGRRVWTRTLDENGQPLSGHPSYQVMGDVVMITSRSVIYTIVVDGTYPGYDRWVYSRFGCTIQNAVLGTAGALISQTCTDPRCTGLKFCGRGPQLLLRSSDPADDKSKNPSNFDHVYWNLIGNTDVPVSADGALSALNTSSHTLALFAAATGRSTGSVQLSPSPTSGADATAATVGDDELVSVGGVAAALDGQPGRTLWSRAVTAPATAVPVGDATDLTTGNARITVPTSSGAAVLDANTGQVTAQITLTPAPATGSSIYPLGAGQLTVGTSGTVAYR